MNCIEVCAEIKEYASDDDGEYKLYLAQTLYELGSVFKSQEAYDLAEKYFNDALPILEENMQKHPENVTPKQFRCYLLCELGELLRDTGRTVQAEECFERFFECAKEFAAPKYASRKFLESAVAGFNALFEFISARHDRAAAKKYYEYGKELRDNLVNPYKEETELLEQYDTLLEKLKSVAESPAQPSAFSSDPCGENEILSAGHRRKAWMYRAPKKCADRQQSLPASWRQDRRALRSINCCIAPAFAMSGELQQQMRITAKQAPYSNGVLIFTASYRPNKRKAQMQKGVFFHFSLCTPVS